MHTKRGHGDRENGANSRKEVTMAMTNNVLVITQSAAEESMQQPAVTDL